MPIIKKGDSEYNFYLPPKHKDGKRYWVPIVTKNKDTLVSFTEGVWSTLSFLDAVDPDSNLLFEYSPSLFLSSDRLVDYIQDGRRLSSMTTSELIDYTTRKLEKNKYASEHALEHPDNNCDFSEFFLYVSCSCGNFIAYNEPFEIPNKNVHCDMCGKTVIEYINEDDENIMYEGIDVIQYERLIEKIKNEIDS